MLVKVAVLDTIQQMSSEFSLDELIEKYGNYKLSRGDYIMLESHNKLLKK